MDAIVVNTDADALRARWERALAAVHLSEDELRTRVETGTASPDEYDAWQEIDTVAFLLGASAE